MVKNWTKAKHNVTYYRSVSYYISSLNVMHSCSACIKENYGKTLTDSRCARLNKVMFGGSKI